MLTLRVSLEVEARPCDLSQQSGNEMIRDPGLSIMPSVGFHCILCKAHHDGMLKIQELDNQLQTLSLSILSAVTVCIQSRPNMTLLFYYLLLDLNG